MSDYGQVYWSFYSTRPVYPIKILLLQAIMIGAYPLNGLLDECRLVEKYIQAALCIVEIAIMNWMFHKCISKYYYKSQSIHVYKSIFERTPRLGLHL